MFEHWIETHNREALGNRVNLRPDDPPLKPEPESAPEKGGGSEETGRS